MNPAFSVLLFRPLKRAGDWGGTRVPTGEPVGYGSRARYAGAGGPPFILLPAAHPRAVSALLMTPQVSFLTPRPAIKGLVAEALPTYAAGRAGLRMDFRTAALQFRLADRVAEAQVRCGGQEWP
jgi:hypothetical protein